MITCGLLIRCVLVVMIRCVDEGAGRGRVVCTGGASHTPPPLPPLSLVLLSERLSELGGSRSFYFWVDESL